MTVELCTSCLSVLNPVFKRALLENMVEDTKLACDALLELEGEDWGDTALGMLYSPIHGARLQQLVLDLRGTAKLAGAVRTFVYQNQGV